MLKIYICKRLYFSFPPSEYQKMKETRLMKKKIKKEKEIRSNLHTICGRAKNIDRCSTLHSFNGLLQLMHANISYIRFLLI